MAPAARKTEFTSLPTELRFMIWCETFKPRILHISSMPPHSVIRRVRFKVREPPPVALQICHESRALALKHYIPSFQLEKNRDNSARPDAIYFCPELDTVHLSDDGRDFYYLEHCTDKTARRIRALTVGSPFIFVPATFFTAHFFLFESLETLTIVVKGELRENENRKAFILEYAKGHMVRIQKEWLQKMGKEWRLPVFILFYQDHFIGELLGGVRRTKNIQEINLHQPFTRVHPALDQDWRLQSTEKTAHLGLFKYATETRSSSNCENKQYDVNLFEDADPYTQVSKFIVGRRTEGNLDQ